MKKIFTLVFALGLISSAFAQRQRDYDRNDRNNDYAYNSSNNRDGYGRDDRNGYGRDNDNTYFFSPRERDMQIAVVNRDFDQRIFAIERSRFLRSYERKREIRNLEQGRRFEIRNICARFDDRRNKFNWKR